MPKSFQKIKNINILNNYNFNFTLKTLEVYYYLKIFVFEKKFAFQDGNFTSI